MNRQPTFCEAVAPSGGAGGLRVAVLSHRFPVLSETFVATLSASMLARGLDLRVLAMDPDPPAGPRHDFVDRMGLGGRLSRASEAGRLSARRALALARAAPARAGYLAGLVMLDRVAPRRSLAVTRMMAAQPAFDVVHAQFGYLGLTALRHRSYGTLRCRALVVHLRGYDITRFVDENGARVYAGLFRKADLFIANCAHFRDRAIRLGCDPGKIVAIGSPIDTDRFAPPARREPVGGRPVRLVAVGRLVEKKGFADAVDAMALLRQRGCEAQLDILGDGELRDALAARIAAAGLGDTVHLHGAATQDRVIAALHRADIALAPSVHAGTGDEDAPVNTLKEAMATGLPVVATRHGGIPELVIPGENGALVPERDPAALADAIAETIGRRADWPRLGRAGREKVVAEYDHRHIAEKTIAAYTQALSRVGEYQ